MKNRRYLRSIPLILSILFLTSAVCSAKDNRFVTLKIYHTNDIHSHLVPNNLKRGGLAYLASVLRLLSSQEPESLILDAGDMYKKGHLPARKTHDEVMADLVALMPYYDARAIGNNEVKVGVTKLQEWAATKEKGRGGGKTPLLSSNFVDHEGKPVFTPSIVLTKAGLKVGVIGLTAEATFDRTEGLNVQPDPAQDPRSPYRVENDEASLKPIIADLRPKADVLILLVHEDFKRAKVLAAEFPEVDLWVCGHSHILTPPQHSEGRALLVQSGEFAQQLGVATLVYDTQTKKVLSEDSEFWPIGADLQIPEPHMEKAVSEAYKKYAPEASEKVGDLNETLTLLRASSPYEGSLLDWVADVMKSAGRADVAIVNRDMVRENLIKGPITQEDLNLSVPYDDQIAVLTLPRRKLEEMIRSSSVGDFKKTGLLPFGYSGVKSSVLVDTQNDDLKKVTLKFDTKKSDLTVSMPNYMVKHCDFFFEEKFCPLMTLETLGNVTASLTEFVKSHPQVSAPEGRRVIPIFGSSN